MKNQKYTLKQIREWFRQLEENRYRKRYMVDAKRVHHYVNLGEDTDLPASLQRKNGAYTREKALAKQFKKFVREQARLAKEEKAKKVRNEGIISSIRKIVKEHISESNRSKIMNLREQLKRIGGAKHLTESTAVNFTSGANLNVLKKFGTFDKGGKLYTLNGTNQPMLVSKKGSNIESLTITSGLRVSKFDDRAWEKQLYKLAKSLGKSVDDEYGDYEIG